MCVSKTSSEESQLGELLFHCGPGLRSAVSRLCRRRETVHRDGGCPENTSGLQGVETGERLAGKSSGNGVAGNWQWISGRNACVRACVRSWRRSRRTIRYLLCFPSSPDDGCSVVHPVDEFSSLRAWGAARGQRLLGTCWPVGTETLVQAESEHRAG